MTDPAPTKNTGTRGSLGIFLARKAAIAFVIISAYVILAPVFLSSRGSYRPLEMVRARVSVQVLHNSRELPKAYLCLVQVQEDGTDMAARIPLRYGHPLPLTGEQAEQHAHSFSFDVWYSLDIFHERGHGIQGIFDKLSHLLDVVHKRRAYSQLWHPERYRLQVTSPLNIKSEPPYYRVSELDYWENDFVVTVLEGTQ